MPTRRADRITTVTLDRRLGPEPIADAVPGRHIQILDVWYLDDLGLAAARYRSLRPGERIERITHNANAAPQAPAVDTSEDGWCRGPIPPEALVRLGDIERAITDFHDHERLPGCVSWRPCAPHER